MPPFWPGTAANPVAGCVCPWSERGVSATSRPLTRPTTTVASSPTCLYIRHLPRHWLVWFFASAEQLLRRSFITKARRGRRNISASHRLRIYTAPAGRGELAALSSKTAAAPLLRSDFTPIILPSLVSETALPNSPNFSV